MEKSELRKQIRLLKKEVTLEEKLRRSEGILHRVEGMLAFASAQVVLLYWSMDDEVQTHRFVDQWFSHKTLLLPCVDGDLLRLRQYTGPQCMHAGDQFGIGEPTGEEWLQLDKIDMIVVPGVAFDRTCNRMGRGRGFYDRLLSTTPNAMKVGVGFDFQLLESIPVDPHDQPMDAVVTESELIIR